MACPLQIPQSQLGAESVFVFPVVVPGCCPSLYPFSQYLRVVPAFCTCWRDTCKVCHSLTLGACLGSQSWEEVRCLEHWVPARGYLMRQLRGSALPGTEGLKAWKFGFYSKDNGKLLGDLSNRMLCSHLHFSKQKFDFLNTICCSCSVAQSWPTLHNPKD